MKPLNFGRAASCFGGYLSNDKIREVQSLLADGLSQREVAKRAEVSRNTVFSVASGKRGLRSPPTSGHPDQPGADFGELRIAFPDPTGEFVRCGECGALVQMPCLGCQLLAAKRRNRF